MVFGIEDIFKYGPRCEYESPSYPLDITVILGDEVGNYGEDVVNKDRQWREL